LGSGSSSASSFWAWVGAIVACIMVGLLALSFATGVPGIIPAESLENPRQPAARGGRRPRASVGPRSVVAW
ncbi:MAG TPA: hypothetical protein VIY73_28005, partial [Polyangiaceae bacterium]